MNNKHKTCECGKVWVVTRHKMPHGARDDGSLTCTCGREIVSWNGGYTYTIKETAAEPVQKAG